MQCWPNYDDLSTELYSSPYRVCVIGPVECEMSIYTEKEVTLDSTDR